MQIVQLTPVKQYQIVLIPITVITSVVLVCSCLFLKRLRQNERNDSSSVPDKEKSGDENNKTHGGIINTAVTVGSGDNYENRSSDYDYATNEFIRKEVQSKLKTRQNKICHADPAYIDDDDSSASFYFTLERDSAPQNLETDEGTYAVAIPENIYDTPEIDGEICTEGISAEMENNQSQFYHTLEECSENENGEDQKPADTSLGKEKNIHSPAKCDNSDGLSKSGVMINMENNDDEIIFSDEETYVINIPNEVSGKKDLPAKNFPLLETNEEQKHNIPRSLNDAKKSSQVDNCDGHVGIEGDKFDGNTRVDGDRYSGHLEQNEDENVGENEDLCEQEVYENATAYAFPNNQRQVFHTAAKSSEKAYNSQENEGYLEDEIYTENTPKENMRRISGGYVIPAETFSVTANKRENSRAENNECHSGEDIYENWEDNVIGRGMKSMNSSLTGDVYLNECGDEIYLNENFDTTRGNHEDSGFYENLTAFRHSLVVKT